MGSPIDLTLGRSTQTANGNGYHCGPSHKIGSVYPGGYLESLRKAGECVQSMEEERRKVEGFKRELPICIQLLEDAIQAVKEKLANGKDMPALQLSCSSMDSEKERCDDVAMESRPTLEEFLPLKRRWGAAQQTEGSDGDTEKPPRGSKRPAWMAKAQLWTQNSTSTEVCHEEKEPEHLEQEQSTVTNSQLNLLGSNERFTGAFLPFLREQPGAISAPLIRPTPRTAQSGAGLSLSFGEPITRPNSWKAASDSEEGSIDVGLQTPGIAQIGKDTGMAPNGTLGAGSSTKGNPSKRKARRCWSPELHRRFVSALHQLGGADIATPKQICELMKVDGLTNDEVKSHLQKYRLHTRRPSPSPQPAAGAQSPQLVVLGGIWMPPKYTSSASQPTPCVYGSSTGKCHPSQPTQFYQSAALPQDHYFACISNGTSGDPVHRQPVFEPQQAASQSQSSPQGPLQVTSQLSEATQGLNSEVYHDESGEEVKSDSTSWKNCRSSDRDSEFHGSKIIESGSGEPELKKSNLNLPVVDNVQSGGKFVASEEEVNQAQ